MSLLDFAVEPDDLLSQAEVYALLSGMDGGDIETLRYDGKAVPLDLHDYRRRIKTRMPLLEMIMEEFASKLRPAVFKQIFKTTEIGVFGVNVVPMSEYLRNLFLPTSLNIVRLEEFNTSALITYDPKLVFSYVDYLFGGLGKFAFRIEGREFTYVENEVITIINDTVAPILKAAWDRYLPDDPITFEFMKREVNPSFVTVASPMDQVIVIELSIDLEGVGGEMHIVIPYDALSSIIPKLMGGTVKNEVESVAWKGDLSNTEVTLEASVTLPAIVASDVKSLCAGDMFIIEKELMQSVDVKANGEEICKGEYFTDNVVKLGEFK